MGRYIKTRFEHKNSSKKDIILKLQNSGLCLCLIIFKFKLGAAEKFLNTNGSGRLGVPVHMKIFYFIMNKLSVP